MSNFVGDAAKRALDLLCVICGGPFVLGIAAYTRNRIKKDSPGDAIYSGKRLGRHGRLFPCYKFRSMYVNGDEILEKYYAENPEKKAEYEKYHKLDDDPRVTPFNYDENALSKYGLEKDSYYFAMSSLEPNKNFKWIAEQAVKNSNELYVVAGSINDKVFSEGLGFKCPDNMKLIGYVSDEEAKTLMRDCNAFLFPSIYEGFGIPPLEAMSAGAKRIIVSDIPVMYEIFESVFEYNANTNVHDIVISSNKIALRILIKYSWNKSAKLIIKSII